MIADLKPYPSMKKSGVEWLGFVPEHWDVLPNRALFTEVEERDHPAEQMLSVTIARGVIQQQELLTDSSKKDASNLDKSAYKLVQPGDIAYNKMRAWQGSLGVSAYRGIVSPAYVVQRPHRPMDSRYFHYLLRMPAFAKEAERWSYGITSDMWSLRPEHFRMIYGCFPPLSEQAAIIRYLDYVDRRIRRYIRAKQQLIALLEEQKQAIIHRAVTRGLDPDVRLEPSGVEWLGDVPEHWEVGRLKTRLLRNDAGAWGNDFSDVGTVVLRSTEQTVDGGWNINAPARRLLSEHERAATRLRAGDLVVTKSSGSAAHIGKTSLVSAEIEAMHCGFSNFMQRLRPAAGVYPRYLWFFLNSKSGRDQLVYYSSTTTGLGNLSGTILGNLQMAFPPPDEQEKLCVGIALRTTPLQAAIDRTKEEMFLLREYRIRLIADVVTGKVDVRAIAAQLPDEIQDVEDLIDMNGLAEGEEDAEHVLDAELEEIEA